MDELGAEETSEQTGGADVRRFRVVLAVAVVLSVIFALPHLASGLAADVYGTIYSDLGGELPALTVSLIGLGRSGALPFVLFAIDIAVFAGMFALAKRFWIGLLFATPLVYVAMTSLVSLVLYAPLLQTVVFIQ